MDQTQMVIYLLNDFRMRVFYDRKNRDYRKIELLTSLGKEIEIEHSKQLFMRRSQMTDRWIESWIVPGSGTKEYKVSRDREGNFGCSCPAWINEKGQKSDCKHILKLKLNLALGKPATAAPDKKFVYQDRGRSAESIEPKHANLTRVIHFED